MSQPETEGSLSPDGRPVSTAVDIDKSPSWLLFLMHGLALFCLFAFVSVIAIRPKTSMDEDLWWHLQTGNWIQQHRAVPHSDSFGLYTHGLPWVAYTWLFDTAVSAVFGVAGLRGVLAATVALLLLFAAILLATLSRYTNFGRALTLTAAAVVATIPLFEPRPWLVSMIFLVVEIYCLLRLRENSGIRWAFILPFVFALWANMHVQFVYGLAVLGLAAIDRTFPDKRATEPRHPAPTVVWIDLVASLLATFLNPYGVHLYDVVGQYFRQSAPLQVISEMQPMQFREITDWATIALAGVALLALARATKRNRLLLLVWLLASYLGLRASRDTWFLIIVSVVVIAYSSVSGNKGSEFNWKPAWAIGMPLGLLVTVACMNGPAVTEQQLASAVSRRFPQAAVEYIKAHHLSGPLYNIFDWGGYLIWSLPQMPVSIDGRANLQGDERLNRYILETQRGEPGWNNDPDLVRANTILVDRKSPLASLLKLDSTHQLVYEDKLAAVFTRR